MSNESMLKNTSKEAFKISHGGRTLFFAGTDPISDEPIPHWFYKRATVVRHTTAKGLLRELPSAEPTFEIARDTKQGPTKDAVLCAENMHKVPTKQVSEFIAMSRGRLKAFAVHAPEVIDATSRLSLEKRALELEKSRLEAEVEALRKEMQESTAKERLEAEKLRTELGSLQARFKKKQEEPKKD